MAKHIVVIGAGVTGLTAAHRLTSLARMGAPVRVTVIERDSRVGGKLWTEYAADGAGGELVVDGGSDSYLTAKPAVATLASELGIAGEIVGTNDANKGTFIVKRGRLLPLVDGMMMFAPTKVIPLATSRLYSWAGKIRMGLDLLIPAKRQPSGGPTDESLESLVVRRLGRECLDRVAEPLVGGVNGSDPATMSVLATYPVLLEMEQRYGSLIRGFLAQRKGRERAAGAAGAAGKGTFSPAGRATGTAGVRPRTMFSSFRRGLGFLTDTLAASVGAEHVRTAVGVAGIVHTGADGGRMDAPKYRVTLTSGEQLEADGVIITTEAWAAADLVRPLDADAAAIVDSIPSSSCATIVMAFRAQDFTYSTRWHGALTPAVERRHVTGISLVTSKWEGRADRGTVVLRCFVGGARDSAVLGESDEALIAIAREAYRELLGVPLEAPVSYARVFRFDRGMPQYTVGHLDRMAALDERIADLHGVALAGGAYGGVGVPNCVESGERAAAKVLADLEIAVGS